MSEVKYAGVKVRLGGEDLIIPSLSMAKFIEHYDLLTKPHDAQDRRAIEERFKELVPVIGEAVRRNYPEKNDEWLAKELDMVSFPLALKAVQNASGVVASTTGE